MLSRVANLEKKEELLTLWCKPSWKLQESVWGIFFKPQLGRLKSFTSTSSHCTRYQEVLHLLPAGLAWAGGSSEGCSTDGAILSSWSPASKKLATAICNHNHNWGTVKCHSITDQASANCFGHVARFLMKCDDPSNTEQVNRFFGG